MGSGVFHSKDDLVEKIINAYRTKRGNSDIREWISAQYGPAVVQTAMNVVEANRAVDFIREREEREILEGLLFSKDHLEFDAGEPVGEQLTPKRRLQLQRELRERYRKAFFGTDSTKGLVAARILETALEVDNNYFRAGKVHFTKEEIQKLAEKYPNQLQRFYGSSA
ncbi:MAG: hypothetical protein QXM31_03765 [Candidatus Woesearchaeota archaeon]